jgi:hypothetical protein
MYEDGQPVFRFIGPSNIQHEQEDAREACPHSRNEHRNESGLPVVPVSFF